jgi:hypothetical protein
MKVSSDDIGNRTRDLPVCSAVPQTNALGTIPGDKGGRCVGLTTLPPLCADCLKIWEPQPAGTLRACQGL